jgi:hypothetical protein
MGISNGIPAVPRNRKLSEFRSEPFRERENNSEFCSVEQQKKELLELCYESSAEEKITGILFCGTKIEETL